MGKLMAMIPLQIILINYPSLFSGFQENGPSKEARRSTKDERKIQFKYTRFEQW